MNESSRDQLASEETAKSTELRDDMLVRRRSVRDLFFRGLGCSLDRCGWLLQPTDQVAPDRQRLFPCGDPGLPTDRSEPVTEVGRRVMQRCERMRRVPRFPGYFCSQLIAEFYRRLGLPLFEDGREPRKVHPNDLAHSLLQAQPKEIARCGALENLMPRDPEEDVADSVKLWSLTVRAFRRNSAGGCR